MFRGLINDVKAAAGSVVTKYAARASVAVPFIIAFGFATAGVTLMLVERFGHRNAYFMVAAGFTARTCRMKSPRPAVGETATRAQAPDGGGSSARAEGP